MSRKELQASKYIAAFAVTTLVFVIGIIVGNQISTTRMDELSSLQQDLEAGTLGSELQFLIMSEHPCASLNSSLLSDELFVLGSKVDFMETQLGKNNHDVLRLKEYYSLLEIKHWFFLKKAKEDCNATYNLLLYFYSNKGDCDECEQQGNVLSYIHRKYPGTNIYSFDINIENPAVSAVKEIYKVKATPTIVANDKVFTGLIDNRELEEILFNITLD